MARSGCCWWLALVVVVVVGVVDGKRPELVGSSVWFTNSTLLNVNFDVAVVQMDFDQPLYTNGQSFLCPESDVACPERTCKACDWSGQEPSGCDDSDCCGPAQSGDMESARAWCSSDVPAYETLRIGETSKRYTMTQGERMYVRFFVPEEYHCRPFVVAPRPYYGTVSSSFSTLDAIPSFSTISGWRNGQTQKTFGFGQSSVLFCPNTTIHPEYSVGTYSGMIYALVATSFEIEIHMSPEQYPLDPPPVRLPCDEVPDEVMNYASTHEPAYCVEDGKSLIIDSSTPKRNEQISLVLPIPKGCHTITVSSASEMPTSSTMSHWLFCLPTETDQPREMSNAALFSVASNGQTKTISACFEEEITYMFCSLRILRDTPIHFSFSTVAPVIRKKMTEIPDASLAYMDGIQSGWGANFGFEKFTCIDYYTSCFDWIVTPSNNTVFLFPPPASPLLNTEQTFEDLQEFYRDAGLSQKQENRLSLVVAFQMGPVNPIDLNLTSLAVVITGITNEDGEIVDLPGGAIDANPESQKQYSISNWVTHIPMNQIPELVPPACDTDSFNVYQEIVDERLVEVGTKNQLVDVLALKYSLDAMNEALLARTCTNQVTANLDTFTENVVKTDSYDCLYQFGTLQFWADPCCNPFISLVSCCLPFDYNTTETPYGTTADTNSCGEPECAESYYEELAFSLNNFQEAAQGCTSGVVNPTVELTSVVVETLREQYISCLVLVGFGEYYDGMPCQVDDDCGNYLGECYDGACVLPSLEEVENQFLECYIGAMSSSLEFYLKRNVLSPQVKDAPRNSTEFINAVREAATVKDCVNPNNPLAIDERTRYQGRPLDYACVAYYIYGLDWPENAEEVYELCPGKASLRSFANLLNTSSCIFEICYEYDQEYIESKEETCPTSDCDIDVDGDCDGSYCVYCPENGDIPCEKVDSFMNEADCLNGVACELPDGTISYAFTAEECRAQMVSCSTDCAGNSCESIYNLAGGCFIPSLSSSSDCSVYSATYGVATEWFKNSTCVLPDAPESQCSMLPGSSWQSCGDIELDDCTGETAQEQFLGCYVSLWHECQNQMECEASGMCTDRDYFAQVQSYDPVNVQYGACITSGEYDTGPSPFCGNTRLWRTSIVGCVSQTITEQSSCRPPAPFIFSEWVTPATTESECLAHKIGFRGCQLYTDPLDVLLWVLDEDECACRGGALLEAWEWIPGVWGGGIPRSLEWKEAKRETYEYKDSLSFVLLADWIEQSVEEKFLYPLQSQIICESESINYPVFALVCDCLADGGERCYESGEEQKVVQMGLSEVCEGEITFVKDPSAQVLFGKESVSEGCSFLNISIIYRNWFNAPFVPPPLSFKWEDPKDRGVVINSDGATVGEVLGDGLVLSFSSPQVVDSFDCCLRLGTEPEDYEVADFGFTTSELENIYPLGIEKLRVDDREADGVWYCVSLNFQKAPTFEEGTVRLFPINRLENYEEEENSYVKHSTESLCYTLGALYCFLGALCFIGFVLFIRETIKTKRNNLSLPNFCTCTFLILCIFRAVFMFMYPTGAFEFEPLTYFVLFEIPTFLLFSVLIFMIYSFKRLVYKKGFFPGNPTPILVIGWSLVWSMWVIVTIVYSEVILDDAGGESACEGRVETSYDEAESDTRNLAIAYQSVIIAITLGLTATFFYYTYEMYSSTKKKTSSLKQFVIVVGGSFNIAFFLRTVLFLVILIGDFASAAFLFCTLFFTEILMMVFLLVQFNIRYLRILRSVVTTQEMSGMSGSTSMNS